MESNSSDQDFINELYQLDPGGLLAYSPFGGKLNKTDYSEDKSKSTSLTKDHSINDKLHELYSQHYGKDYIDKIVPCGVVDEEEYLKSKPRIVFVLKEAHSSETGWKIPEGLHSNINRGKIGFKKKYVYTWNQAGIWAYAIHHGFKPYSELNRPEIIAEGISTIGMTNLKKTGGGAVAIPREIKSCAKSEVDLWKRELEIMDPELIICGKTYANVKNNLGLIGTKIYEEQGGKFHAVNWNINEHKAVILQFFHPACRKPRAKTLELLNILLNKIK